MHPARKKRLLLIIGMLSLIGIGVGLVLNALNQDIRFFFSPTQVKAGEAPVGHPFRIGGLVSDGSLQRSKTDLQVSFDVSDGAESVRVTYTGILPDLFREGQGIVALGSLNKDGLFSATEVLAKHDENYMPPEVAEALEKSGASQHGSQTVQQ